MPLIKYDRSYKEQLLIQLEEYVDSKDFPFLSGFTSSIKSYKQHLYDMADAKTDSDLSLQVSYLIKRAKEKCEAHLVMKLVEPKVNFVPIMFLLKSMHQFRDNTVLEVQGRDGKPIQLDITGKSVKELQDTMLKYSRRSTTKAKTKK